MFPQIDLPVDIFNTRRTCKLFYTDQDILNLQKIKMKKEIESLCSWSRIRSSSSMKRICKLPQITLEEEYFLQKLAKISRNKNDTLRDMEIRISIEAFCIMKTQNVIQWFGIDEFDIVINNNIYRFTLPESYPLDSPRVECRTNSKKVVKIHNWKPTTFIYTICQKISNEL